MSLWDGMTTLMSLCNKDFMISAHSMGVWVVYAWVPDYGYGGASCSVAFDTLQRGSKVYKTQIRPEDVANTIKLLVTRTVLVFRVASPGLRVRPFSVRLPLSLPS